MQIKHSGLVQSPHSAFEVPCTGRPDLAFDSVHRCIFSTVNDSAALVWQAICRVDRAHFCGREGALCARPL